MKMSDKGLAQLASEEGLVLGFYKDNGGVKTWGIGVTAKGYSGFKDLPERPTQTQVVEQFKQDVARYTKAVNNAIKVPVTQTQFDALVSFQYNTGGIHRAALTKKLNAGNVIGAARAFMGWLRPVSVKGRRKREQALFRDGVYSNRPIAIYSGGNRKRLGTMTPDEFTRLLRPLPVDLPDHIPDTPEVTAGLGVTPPWALAIAGMFAALGVFWNDIIAFIGGIFG